MSDPSGTAFDWQDHVRLSSNLTPEQAAAVSKSLDDIASTPDGQQLLASGSQLQNGPIFVYAGNNGSTHQNGIVSLDFNQIENVTYADARGYQVHPSLTGVLVHELYHAADSLNNEHVLRAAVKPELDTVLAAHGHPPSDELTWDEIIAITDQLPEEESLGVLRRSGVVSESGVPRSEQDATAYTDAYMEKYFAGADPQRRDYTNATMQTPSSSQPYAGTRTPDVSPVVAADVGFSANTYGVDPSLVSQPTPVVHNDGHEFPMATAPRYSNAFDQLLQANAFQAPVNQPTDATHVANDQSAQLSVSSRSDGQVRNSAVLVTGQ